jgi:cytidine deaminase
MRSELTEADRELVAAARAARAHSHAPISNYRVGAALRTAHGEVFTGCNVEDILLNLSCCAERVALVKAISEGHRAFEAVAVITDGRPVAAPCGCCRQQLHTWGVERVVVANVQGDVEVVSLSELLPRSFELRGPVAPQIDP